MMQVVMQQKIYNDCNIFLNSIIKLNYEYIVSVDGLISYCIQAERNRLNLPLSFFSFLFFSSKCINIYIITDVLTILNVI